MTGQTRRIPGDTGPGFSNNIDDESTTTSVVPAPNARTGLTEYLSDIAGEHGVPLKNLTVLAPQNDPFRVGTEASRRDGAWLAEQCQAAMADRRIHLRGLHYALIGQTKPDGTQYVNTDRNWEWLIGQAAKSARWNGYIGFDQIVDQKNAPPTIRWAEPIAEPIPTVSIGDLCVEIPDANDMVPKVEADPPFRARQKYRLAMYGEKSSLEDVLLPLADQFDADLFLPSGEMSDTLIWQLASAAAEDGRPLVLFTFSDCDPAGWQMPISISRKLQAFKTLLYPDLEFEVVRVGLTPDHVRQHGLPSTPLKEKETRADKWTEATGVRQTEIDALATLQPTVLRRIALDAIQPYFDRTLSARITAAHSEWQVEAQARFEEHVGAEQLDEIRDEAENQLEELRDEIRRISESLRIEIDTDELDLPDIVVPEYVEPDLDKPNTLIDSRDAFVDQCADLIASKSYDDVDGDR